MRNYPNEYIQYLVEFHGRRDYYECHEILEEYWKEHPPLERDSVWVGLIQIAVGLYHYRRGNHPGAVRTLSKARHILMHRREETTTLGLDFPALDDLLANYIQRIQANTPYESPMLPLADPALVSICEVECRSQGLTWGCQSDLTDTPLIHRHSHRDRTDVIEERFKQLKIRRNK